jgi:adenylosuccinate lyase
LLALTQRGVSREDGYKIVQRAAMKVWRSFGIDPDDPDAEIELNDEDREAAAQDNRLMFFLATDSQLTDALSKADMDELFNVDPVAYHTKNVDTIFARVFGKA